MTLLLISFLAFQNKPTLVEMRVTVQSASFVALPPVMAEGDEENLGAAIPSAARKISLFPPFFAIEAMEVKGVDCVETTLDSVGPVALQTEPGGSIGIKDINKDRPLRPKLVLNEPTSLGFEIVGQDKVTISLEQSGPAQPLVVPARPVTASSGQAPRCAESVADDRGWSASLPTGPDLSLRLRDVRSVRSAGAALADFATAETCRVSRDAARFSIAGGRRESQLSLALPRKTGPSTQLRVLDPATGDVVLSKSLPIALSESRSLSWQDKLVLLDPEPAGEQTVALLRPDLKVRNLKFARGVQLEAKSFVLEGEVRFPAGEKEPIKLEPGSFISLAADDGQPLTLRSLELSNQGLALLLWGEPTSLRIGPTPELRVERLPSYFEWLLTHRLGSLIYGTLAYVSALSLAVFKLLGWVKG